MSILYIITSADGGGAQKYVLDLAKTFAGSIAAGTEATQLFEAAKSLKLKTYPLNRLKRNVSPINDLLAIWEIYKLIKKINPEIVHLNSSKAGFLGSIAGKLAGKKVVFTAHGFFYFKRAPWHIKLAYAFLEKFASLFRDFIITVSDEDKQQALAHNLINSSKIQTIHNGISPLPFVEQNQARQNLNLNGNNLILGNIAQLYNRKAIDVLIDAFCLIPKKLQEKITAVVIGSGPELENLKLKIENLKLKNQFILAGYKPQAVNLLKAFDVFVLSSRREGFPYVILEAMQAGLPIIATNIGGVKEALGEAGVLVPAEDPKALADGITKLINNPNLMKELSAKALIQSQRFTLEKMLSETEHIYKKLLS